MAQQEVESLKQTLHTQQKLLHQLYVELEAEREASSSAASEALSMILRLQEEKAACQLEACQFKRMTEEKMNHADEIQQVFEQMMHKKEMEIASLEFQVKAYHYKLLSLGTAAESEPPDFHTLPLSRMQSLPALPLSHTDIPQITVEELISPNKADEHPHQFYFQTSGVQTISPPPRDDLASHWQQIKELDERVKGLSHATLIDQTMQYNRSKELGTTSVVYPDELQIDLDSCFQLPENDLMLGLPDPDLTYSASTSQVKEIHDVFEVPQHNDSAMLYSPQNQKQRQGKKLVLEDDNRLRNPDLFPIKCCCSRDEAVCGKSMSLQYPQNENNKWSTHRDGANLNSQLTNQIVSPVQPDFKHLNERLERLENETRLRNQQVSGPYEENIRLLKEIREKLDTIQDEIIRCTKFTKHPAADEASLVSLMETMFFYSL